MSMERMSKLINEDEYAWTHRQDVANLGPLGDLDRSIPESQRVDQESRAICRGLFKRFYQSNLSRQTPQRLEHRVFEFE